MTQMNPPVDYNSPQPRPAGMAIASMVLGLVSLVTFCVWYLSIPCAIIAIVLGVIAFGKVKRGEGGGQGMAKTGFICGIVALVIDVIVVILIFTVGVTFFRGFNQAIQKAQQQQQQQQRQLAPPSAH